MRFNRHALALVVAVCSVFGSAAVAKEKIYLQCDLPGQEAMNWIKPQIFVAYEPGAKHAIVADKLIMRMEGEPMRAEMRDRKNSILLNWIVTKTRDSSGNQSPALLFTLEYKKSSSAVSVRMRPRNYANILRGRGSCKPLKNKAEFERSFTRG